MEIGKSIKHLTSNVVNHLGDFNFNSQKKSVSQQVEASVTPSTYILFDVLVRDSIWNSVWESNWEIIVNNTEKRN